MDNKTRKDRVANTLFVAIDGYANPTALLNDIALSRSRKIEILQRWEYDAREMQVAEEEGFPGGPGGLLDIVLTALHTLDSGPDVEHSPPTKQGGV